MKQENYLNMTQVAKLIGVADPSTARKAVRKLGIVPVRRYMADEQRGQLCLCISEKEAAALIAHRTGIHPDSRRTGFER